MSKKQMTLLDKAKALPMKRTNWGSCTREEFDLAMAVVRGDVTLVAASKVLTTGKSRQNGQQYLYRILASAIRLGWLVKAK